MAPLVGARPLRPTATVQRATDRSVAEQTASISRGFDTEVIPLRADGFTQGDDMTLPAFGRPMETAWISSHPASALTHVAPQPRSGQAHESAALSVERPIQRAADFPLAPVQRVAVETPLEPAAPSVDSTSQVVQRGWFDSVSSEVGGLSSRAPSLADAGSPVSTVGSAIGSMFGGHKEAETDMDELAGKLYDKIRTRLKSELLVDRERAGFLTDLR